MISEEYLKALTILSEKLVKTRIEWYVTGKTNLALQGINIKPSHLGILIRDTALDAFLKLFDDFPRSQIIELDNGEAKEFKLGINGISVMVCAEYPYGTYWVVMKKPIRIKLGKLSLPCFSLESEKVAYEKLGMPEKAQIIAGFLARQDI